MFKLKLRADVSGDSIRTVPLSFKATVKLIQVVGQSLVVSRVGGALGFVVCDLSELRKPFIKLQLN